MQQSSSYLFGLFPWLDTLLCGSSHKLDNHMESNCYVVPLQGCTGSLRARSDKDASPGMDSSGLCEQQIQETHFILLSKIINFNDF